LPYFALGCALSSSYGFLAGTWPFGAVEAIWVLNRAPAVPLGSAITRQLTGEIVAKL
jgi:hypothetical protein